jgi:trehalose 6-phosphate synthase
MTNSDQLIKFVQKQLGDRKLIVAIQREPFIHETGPKGIRVKKSAGGAHILLDGILRKVGGLMVAVAAGDADAAVVDKKGRIEVPPYQPKYTLKRIFLSDEEQEGFYYGFANQTLWPLSHVVFIQPQFNPKWWNEYVKVNQKFAKAILDEVKNEEAVVWVNDYHLALLPEMLKAKRPGIKVGTFWHIPWPTYEIFRICPWRKKILAGLLGSDFIGFHRGYHVENFINCARRELEVIDDSEPRSVQYKNHTTKLAAVPAGIDYHEIVEKMEKNKNISRKILEEDFGINPQYLAIGVDRIDYTKGLLERLHIIDRFLEKYPKYQGKFTYLSIGAPSRTKIPAYNAFNQDLLNLINIINLKYAHNGWEPIKFVTTVLSREKIFSYYQLADVCLVTSLDDGMNLVAKEFIICNKPDKGMLLLSKFTGAAKDLSSALLINPYDTDDSANLLHEALIMDSKEKLRRNMEMKEILKENNIYNWGIEFIKNTLS